jgi:tetratricopeptide (TPR) repeat protein
MRSPLLPRALRFTTILLAAAVVCTLEATAAGKKIPVTTASKEALASFIEGRTLVDNLRLTDAYVHFQKAVERDPSFALAYLYRAQSAPSAKEFFADLSKAAELAPKATEGEKLWITGFRAGAYADPAKQKEIYRKLVEAYPDDERALTLLGIAHFGQFEFAEAARYLEKAVKVAPEFAPAYNQLGYAYRFLERYPEAEKTFSTYTRLIPNDPNPFDSYAELLLKTGRFAEAIVQYRKALAVDKFFANSYAGIAACLAYQGRHDAARDELHQAYDLARTDGERRAALFAEAIIDIDEGKTDQGLATLDRQYEIAEKINDPAAMSGDLALIANVYLENGQTDEARERFVKSNSLIQSSSLAAAVKENAALVHHFNLGRVALFRNDYDTAQEELKKFRQGSEAKKNTNQVRLAHELAGMIALRQEKFDAAIDELKQASDQNPYNLYRLAVAYHGKGQFQESREYCKRAAAFNVLPLANYAFIRVKAEKMLEAL